MSPRPSPLQTLLLRVLRHLVLVLDGVLGARAAELRSRLDALPPTHRRRARLHVEIRRLARMRAMFADPGLLDDAGFRGKATEVARVRNDAGRRAIPRRRIHPTRYRGLSGATPAARTTSCAMEGRCTAGIAVA